MTLERDRLIIVGCVATKRVGDQRWPAADLYTSPLFRYRRAYAEHVIQQPDGPFLQKWFILSAKHGLVSPSTVIEPHDETLNRMAAAARRIWAEGVMSDLTQRLRPGDEVLILAGQRYLKQSDVDLREAHKRTGSADTLL